MAAGKQRRAPPRSKVTALEKRKAPSLPAGLAARELAAELVHAVTDRGLTLDEAGTRAPAADLAASLAPRDRAFARLIAATVLRRRGSLDATVAAFLQFTLPANGARAHTILLVGAAQLLLLGTPAHAAISLAVDQARASPATRRFDKLVNAVLRRVAEHGPAVLADLAWPEVDISGWMWHRWCQAYGPQEARRIAAASLAEAPLDISVKSDAPGWAERLGGVAIGVGTVRLASASRVEDLPGFADGEWWVQDLSATLPARLLGPVSGLRVADLCAAPGGKTAALATAGACVTAVDRSAERLRRLEANMRRLHIEDRVTIVAEDLRMWQPAASFDAILLDAPCTATGTIRRHPDILHLKRSGDAAAMALVQAELLDRAASWLRPGGTLVFCTCSLEPEEGRDAVAAFLARNAAFTRVPVTATEIAAEPAWISPEGDVRTLPHHPVGAADAPPGLDGFFAARLRRRSESMGTSIPSGGAGGTA